MNRTFTAARRFVRFALWCALAALPIGAASRTALAVPVYNTLIAGDWNAVGKWSPAGPPTAGDSVNISHNTTVSSNQSFGDPSENSVLANVIIDPIAIATGQTLTHVAGSTLLKQNNAHWLSGNGTFRNDGTFLHLGGTFGTYGGTTTIENAGTFEFQGASGELGIGWSPGDVATFRNMPGATVRINLASAANTAVIGRTSTSNFVSQFIQEAGANPIEFVQGALVFAPHSNGTLDDAAFINLFTDLQGGNALNANSELRIAGSWNAITLSNTVNLDRVRLSSSSGISDRLVASAGGTTINITHVDGLRIGNLLGPTSNFTTFELPTGRTMTNASTSRLIKSAARVMAIEGNGTFINHGTLEIESSSLILNNQAPLFENHGLLEFTQHGARLDLSSQGSGTPVFRNMAGGTVRVDLPTAASTAVIGRASVGTNVNGQFIQEAGANPIEFVQGGLVFAPHNNGTLDDATFINLFTDLQGGNALNAVSELRIAGSWDAITLSSAINLDRVRLSSGFDANDMLVAKAGGTTINITNAAGLRIGNLPSETFARFELPTGTTMTNAAGSKLIKSANRSMYITGDGTFINDGTLEVEAGAAGSSTVIMYSGTPTFENNGLVALTQNNSRLDLGLLAGSVATFDNLAGGVLRADLPSAANTAVIAKGAAAGQGHFNNLGTVEVLRGTLQFLGSGPTALTSLPQVSAASLDGGTWRVLGHGTTATLDLLDVNGAGAGTPAPFDGTIVSIGAGANLVLSQNGGGTANFPQLGLLSSVAGSVKVHEDMVLPVDPSLSVTGTLGGNGTIVGNTITFSGGALDPSGLNGGPGTLVIQGDLVLSNTTELLFDLNQPFIAGGGVNDFVFVDGDLTLDGVLQFSGSLAGGRYVLFQYTGELLGDSSVLLPGPQYALDLSVANEVAIVAVPEPATWLMLVLGALVMPLASRRRSARRG